MNQFEGARAGSRDRYSLALLLGCLVFLGGCAAQRAYNDGRGLLSQGKAVEGIARLEEAVRLAPDSAEYRLAHLQARERHGQHLTNHADSALADGRYDDAELGYREALDLRVSPERAVAGLRRIEQQRRLDLELKAAEAAIARKDWESAKAKLNAVRTEDPSSTHAAKLLRTIEDQLNQARPEPALAAAYKRPINIEFKDVPLRTIFEVVSRSSRLNFLFDKEVKTDQRTSIYLRNSTVEAAVNWLLLTNQLEQRVLDGNTVLVYPATQAKQREYQPLVVKSFFLTNADAKNVANTLKTLLKLKDVVVDERLNLVIVRDSVEAARMAERLVLLHDAAEPEVMLEVEVLEVKRGRLLDLGVRWPDQATLTLLPASAGRALTLEDFRDIKRGDIGVTVGATTVSAKKQDADTNILANPRIRARNREKARILIGERVPNITTTSTAVGFVAESVNYVDVGIKLEVEPTIYLDGEVAIKVALEVSNIISQQQTKSGSLAYQLGTRSAQTVLRLKDGENQVLAGLINNEDRRSANKVPLLGEVPLLGRLFGNQSEDASKTEIVLSITPRILRNVMRPEAKAMEFDAGTESSLRSWPAEAGQAQSAGVPSSPAAATSGNAGAAAPGQTAPTAAPQAMGGASTQTSPQSSLPAPMSMVMTSNSGTVPGATVMRWEGPTRVAPDDTFSIQLALQSEQAVSSLPLIIGFDPAQIQFVAATEGGFMKADGAPTRFSSKLLGPGQLSVSAARTGQGGGTSPGVLTTLSFKALPIKAPSVSTNIRVLSSAAVGPGGQSVIVPLPAPLTLTISK